MMKRKTIPLRAWRALREEKRVSRKAREDRKARRSLVLIEQIPIAAVKIDERCSVADSDSLDLSDKDRMVTAFVSMLQATFKCDECIFEDGDPIESGSRFHILEFYG